MPRRSLPCRLATSRNVTWVSEMEWLLLVIGGLILINQVEKRSASSPLNTAGASQPSTPYYRVYPNPLGTVAGDPESAFEQAPVTIRMVGASPAAVAASPASVAGGGASSPAGGGGAAYGGGGRPAIRTRVRVALL